MLNDAALTPTTDWHSATIKLSDYVPDYRDQVVRLVFSFNTVDNLSNNYEGWYVDDITVGAAAKSVTAATSSAADQWVLQGTAGQGLGTSVAGIGDYDGNGTSDFAVLARDGTGDAIYILAGGAGEPSLANPLAKITLANFTANDYSLLAAGDVNGDQHDDFLLTSPSEGVNSYVIFGGADSFTLDDTAAVAPAEVRRLAVKGGLIPLGDIDGGGRADIGSGGTEVSDNLDETGRSKHAIGLVYLGETDLGQGFTSADVSLETARPFYESASDSGEVPAATPLMFGAVGDVNHDGIADFALADSDAGHQLHVFAGLRGNDQCPTQRPDGRRRSVSGWTGPAAANRSGGVA